MDDGLALDSTPVAIGLYDPSSGASAIIAALTNSTAVPVSGNQVLYPDAFGCGSSGVACSILYTVENGTFAQDCIFTGRLDPGDWGFSTNCWVQVMTEFYGDVPQPDQVTSPVDEASATAGLTDTMLGFNQFVMTKGWAYTEPAASWPNGGAALVGKQWVVGQRVFLVESLPYARLMAQFLALPECGPSRGQARLDPAGVLKGDYASIPRPPEGAEVAQASRQAGPTASVRKAEDGALRAGEVQRFAGVAPSGVVIDYIANIGGSIGTAVLLSSFTNYFISGAVYLNGALTAESTILEYKTNAFIQLNSTLTCKNVSQFRPVILTAVDDDTVGDSMSGVSGSGYTGVISTAGYANPAIWMNGITSLSLTNFRVCYAKGAILIYGPSSVTGTLTVSHSQFINCGYGVEVNNPDEPEAVNVNNTLMTGVLYPFDMVAGSDATTLTLLHCTFDQSSQTFLVGSSDHAVSVYSTNCVYANQTNASTVSATYASNNGFYSASQFGSPAFAASGSPFQSVGAGDYYLTDASGFRGLGTTSGIPPSLLADIGRRTTYPPLVTVNALLTNSQTLWPQAGRNTAVPDLGFHYDPIDWHTEGCSPSRRAIRWFMTTSLTSR
jgi:hypothetical protein